MIHRNSIFTLIAALPLACGLSNALAVTKDDPAAKELANKSGCMSCHDIGNKVVGPAFKDVAEKYRGQKDAPAMLAKKIKEGGKGVWGRIPMPPHEQLKDGELSTLVGWVLAQ